MSVSIKHITFDANNPQELAEFWGKVTGQPIENDWGKFVVLAEAKGLPRLAFYKTNDKKTVKDRVHLDLKVDDLAKESSRYVEMGARILSKHGDDKMRWYVMADPEGNEFCVSSQW